MAKRKKEPQVEQKQEILVGYVKEFEFNDPVAKDTLNGHPFVGRLYQIIKDDIFGYRLHIGVENTKEDMKMAGILLGPSLVGDYGGKWQFDIAIITQDNFMDFSFPEEDAKKLADWFNTDNEELRKVLDKPVAAVATDPEGNLQEISLSPLSQNGDFEMHPFEAVNELDTRMMEFSDNINLIYEKDPEFMLGLTDLLAYLATTYSDKYEAARKTNYGKRFLIESKSPDTTIFNTMKYIQRYATTGFEKSQNIKDVYKAIHYLLFEIERKRTNG